MRVDAAGAGDATPLGFSELGRYGNEIVFHHRARGLDITDEFHFKHDGRKSECHRAVEIGAGRMRATFRVSDGVKATLNVHQAVGFAYKNS